MQPLSGILVLDFTTLLPGPLATLMLAEAGAEVIKIERPEGEDMRARAGHAVADRAAFALLNRGKKGVTLDLKQPNAVELEIPANAFARHTPWDQLQSFTRLDGPKETTFSSDPKSSGMITR